VLQLPTVPASTAATGFCLSVDAQMPAALPWSAPFVWPRTALAWASNAVDAAGNPVSVAQIYVDGQNGNPTAGQLCLTTTTIAQAGKNGCLSAAAF
jgi:hypothetical protein